ncbi:delta(1)-pyrroline-2-carboxylate reductase [Halolactibacillus alkaliphilus]|uniref:Delta(1)-pyrroline-2-carboxylate reductase n=1 Tax=Halolactibacillus alkaliphilus TaxID=442899 RepID=A0A511X4J7_9BACI|nr:ornithine cyclodeaminase family protein [Halolactibacillus alkaliphilus]GEN57867.1 delta(1)-pyrroline-2-carboxylate reductase [Halolactibacillus alkaliphilus]GGN75619.1 delta(1)-pyrroline-2-carboxylate reductase [Halolactibacillus alkaliphilus]SFP07005.1 ornithine cyclodeaminase [Halolactibacillus alkaliphilus]
MLNGKEYRDWINTKLRIGEELLYLSEAECRALPLSDQEIFNLTERALVLYSQNKTDMPAKIALHPIRDTFYHAMPASIEEVSSAGIKWGSCYPENRQQFGIRQANALIIYNDYLSGVPLAVMDGLYITEIRTPCVSFASAKYMAKPHTKTFGMIGCGIQGREHVRIAHHTLTQLEMIYVYDTYEEAADALIKDLQPYTPCKIIKARSIEELVKCSEVIATATIIPETPNPQIKDAWVTKGQTLLLSDCHSLVEDKTVKRADKYTLDSVAQHELLAGYDYYPHGLPKVYAQIGEVCGGQKAGRESDDELIICNNVGMAVEDMMLLRVLFDRALETNAGRKLPL